MVLGAVLVGVGWFYWWTVRPDSSPPVLAKDYSYYYNLLTHGFMKGHLWLDTPADPFLATLKNPWNPQERGDHGMHDASYFRGRYYIYFGVTPVILLFLPVRIATGLDVEQGAACLLFAWVGLCASACLVAWVRQRYFPRASLATAALALAGLGLADTVPLLLRRASIWETPIACAYACFITGLCFLYCALHSRRRATFLALASAAFGLAVGARPTYLLGCSALLVAPAYWIGEAGGLRRALRSRSWWSGVMAAVLPAAAVGAGLAVYNFERFGHLAEFGQSYQMSGSDGSQPWVFNLSYLIFNTKVYWLLPAHWSPYFPFVALPDLPLPPPGHMGCEDPFGVLPNMPFVLLGLGILAPALSRSRRDYARLLAFLVAVTIAAVVTAVSTMAFWAVANRYMVDFVPGFDVLAAVGLLALAAHPARRAWVTAALRAVAVLLVAYSCAFNVLASIRHNELFRVSFPERYKRLAHSWNTVPYLFDRWFNHGYGDLKIDVIFPQNAAGKNEPLVVTGRSFQADYLIVHYEPNSVVSFAMIHTGSGPIWGKPLKVTPGVPHTVVVSIGSIYPPAGHPFFDKMSAEQALMKQEMVFVSVDGQLELLDRTTFNDAAGWNPSVGRSETKVAYEEPFSGKILGWSRLPLTEAIDSAGAQHSGPAQIVMKLPPFAGAHSEPLLCSGETGRGDLVYMKILSPTQIAIGFDHWGAGGPITEPITVDPSGEFTVTVDYGALHDPPAGGTEATTGTPGRLLIAVDGRTLVDAPQLFYRCSRSLVSVGNNIIGASTAVPGFSGIIAKVNYLGK